MSDIKFAIIASIVAISSFILVSLALVGTAHAAGGIELESILVTGDTVRVEYSSKLRGCAFLMDDRYERAQDRPNLFCAHGRSIVSELPLDALDVWPGDFVQLCSGSAATFGRCSDLVEVRQAGDLDGDGSINISDFMLIYWYVMDESPRWWPTADIDELAADMNGDGDVNVIDILLLLEALREEAENN